MTSASAPTRRRIAVGLLIGAALALGTIGGFLGAERARREGAAEEAVIVEGVRKVCKISTIEVTLADHARHTVPKTIDLPFTHQPEAFLFFSGVVSAGFDVCDQPTRLDVDHKTHVVRLALPPPRILSLDIKRFETINERSGFLNAISPEDRSGWYQSARDSLTKAALDQGVLARAESHARELLGDLVGRWGYRLELTVDQRPSERAQ